MKVLAFWRWMLHTSKTGTPCKCMPERKQPSVRGEQQSTHEDKSTGHACGATEDAQSAVASMMRSAGRL
jgi:hypothetical protein